MIDLELPLTKRTRLYRFFEILPAVMSYGMIVLLIVLSIFYPLAAAIYLLLIIMTFFIKSIGISYHTIFGHSQLVRAQKVDWHERLRDLEAVSYTHLDVYKRQIYGSMHITSIIKIKEMSISQIGGRW